MKHALHVRTVRPTHFTCSHTHAHTRAHTEHRTHFIIMIFIVIVRSSHFRDMRVRARVFRFQVHLTRFASDSSPVTDTEEGACTHDRLDHTCRTVTLARITARGDYRRGSTDACAQTGTMWCVLFVSSSYVRARTDTFCNHVSDERCAGGARQCVTNPHSVFIHHYGWMWKCLHSVASI